MKREGEYAMFNKINKGALTLLLGLVISFSAQTVLADSLNVEITAGAYLQDSGQGRLLLKFDLPSELSGAQVTFAELHVPLTATIPDSSALAVECHPLLVSWVPAEVIWEDLGDSLTGDVVAEQGTQYATASEGAQDAYFDVTDIVRSWQDTSITNNGLILFYQTDTQPYFTYSRDEGEPFGTVRFDYTH
jgi:hypothetical protein